jgi:hypothetical protein
LKEAHWQWMTWLGCREGFSFCPFPKASDQKEPDCQQDCFSWFLFSSLLPTLSSSQETLFYFAFSFMATGMNQESWQADTLKSGCVLCFWQWVRTQNVKYKHNQF